MSFMIRRLASRKITIAVFENVLMMAAVVVAAQLRLGAEGWDTFVNAAGIGKAFVISGICQLCFYFADLYDYRATSERRELFMGVIQAVGGASLVLAVLYFWFPGLIIGRGVFLIAVVLMVVFVGVSRVAVEWFNHRTTPGERLLIVGTSPQAIALARELFDRRAELGVEIVGFVDPDPSRVGAVVLNPGVIGTIDDIPAIARTRGVNRVVVSLVDARGRLPMEKLLGMKLSGIRFDHLPSLYEEYTGKIAVENLRPSWLIFSSGFEKTTRRWAAKRGLDILAGSVGIAIGMPLMVLIAAAVKATSRGPVFYHQQRVGLGGRLFTVHKFRSMRVDAEASTGAVWARPNDDRATIIGRFLRRARLDELPQLWNIVKGEMSLVGPRPERPEFVANLTKQIPFYGERHTVKPGLTGWAQVRYTYGASVEDALEKLQYDLFYIKNMSLSLDMLILLSTVKTVMLRRGSA